LILDGEKMACYRFLSNLILSTILLITSWFPHCKADPAYRCVIKENCSDYTGLYWIAGISVLTAVGAGGYAAGRYNRKEGKQGRTGAVGPMGEPGSSGHQGHRGPAGAEGIEGPAGPQGPKGATGCQGESFCFPYANDELSFYFNNMSIGNDGEEYMVGVVTTPSQELYSTEPISQGRGAFTNNSPMYNAFIGTYHLTLIPRVGGVNVDSTVDVFKNGSLFTTIAYPQGPYTAETQLTVVFTYYPGCDY
jgi:hypothetical protein